MLIQSLFHACLHLLCLLLLWDAQQNLCQNMQFVRLTVAALHHSRFLSGDNGEPSWVIFNSCVFLSRDNSPSRFPHLLVLRRFSFKFFQALQLATQALNQSSLSMPCSRDDSPSSSSKPCSSPSMPCSQDDSPSSSSKKPHSSQSMPCRCDNSSSALPRLTVDCPSSAANHCCPCPAALHAISIFLQTSGLSHQGSIIFSWTRGFSCQRSINVFSWTAGFSHPRSIVLSSWTHGLVIEVVPVFKMRDSTTALVNAPVLFQAIQAVQAVPVRTCSTATLMNMPVVFQEHSPSPCNQKSSTSRQPTGLRKGDVLFSVLEVVAPPFNATSEPHTTPRCTALHCCLEPVGSLHHKPSFLSQVG
jgi:hypothetical protein